MQRKSQNVKKVKVREYKMVMDNHSKKWRKEYTGNIIEVYQSEYIEEGLCGYVQGGVRPKYHG